MQTKKIYTRTGDKGETSLIGGTRVPKYHLRIEAYGTIDELNAFVGLIRDQQINLHYKDILLQIQENLFIAESLLANEDKEMAKRLPCLKENDIHLLEKEMDEMNQELPPLHHFILPGGHTIVSYAHVARCICRRAERIIIALAEKEDISPIIIRYINRLSDYFFVLARKLALDNGTDDLIWRARSCD